MNTSEPLPRKETLDYLEGKAVKNKTKKTKPKKIVKKEVSDIDRMKKFKK